MPNAARAADRKEMFPIKKGKFSQGAAPRRIKREEQELEQAFEQVTRAANGELDDDFFKDVPTSATVSGSAPSHSAESGSVNRNKKIAIISDEQWEIEKNKYIASLKDGNHYVVIDEPEEVYEEVKNIV